MEGDHLKDPDLDGRIILKCILKSWDMDWVDWLRWWAVVNAVMNLLVA
jgi:hypothetical protein